MCLGNECAFSLHQGGIAKQEVAAWTSPTRWAEALRHHDTINDSVEAMRARGRNRGLRSGHRSSQSRI